MNMQRESAWRHARPFLAVAFGVYSLVQGVGLVGAPRRRFTGPALEWLNDVPGGVDLWGYLLAAAGILALGGLALARPRVVVLSLGFITVWHAMFLGAYTNSFLSNPASPLTGVVASALLVALGAFATVQGGWYARDS